MNNYDITIINSGLLKQNPTVPIGPLIITAILEQSGYNVQFKDYQLIERPNRISPDTFAEFCFDSADIIGISVMCNSLPTVLKGIMILKDIYPYKKVILGGPGATDVGALLLEFFPIDFIVFGEGERAIIELLKILSTGGNLKSIKGIAYREFNKIIITQKQERILNLSEIPLPAYHHVDFKKYGQIATIITARGCPFMCKFCSAHSIFQRKMTYRNVEDVVKEIKLLAPYSWVIAFADDTFLFDQKRAKQIVNVMREEGIDLPWSCNGKINLMNKDILDFMKKENCIQVFYGIESGSNKILKKINKGHTIEEARKVINETIKYVNNVRTSYIWGYPFELLEDFYATVDSLYLDMTTSGVISQLSLLSPLPSSTLYKEYKDLLDFRIDAQSRAGGLPLDVSIDDYPYLIKLIMKYPKIFSSFYFYKNKLFDQKLNIIKKIDWQYNDKKRKELGY